MKTDKPLLLVEDDEVDVLTVRRALKDLEVANELLVASNGEEALEILRNRGQEPKPALVLLDLNMPRMNGLEFLRQARSESLVHGIPVVVLTTSRQDQDILEGFELAVAGYMVKPVDYRKFVEVMATIDRYWSISELPQ
ncbi:MAG: response regulator [Thermoanaerobaculia bacterium]|nr:response regulator [Thermoanaerobaculia bacterium]